MTTQTLEPTQQPLGAAPLQKVGASMRSWGGLQGGKYYLVQTMDQFWEFWHACRAQRTIAVDTETTGFDIVRDRACGIVIGWDIEHNFYLPIAHITDERQLDLEKIREPLREILEDPTVTKIFWNEKFDRHFLKSAGLDVRGVRHDGVVLTHLLDENIEKELKGLALKYISRTADKWEKAVHAWRTDEAKRRRHAFQQLVQQYHRDHREELEAEYLADKPFAKFSGMTKAQLTSRLKKVVTEKFKDSPLARNKKSEIGYHEVPLEILGPYACADSHYTLLMYKMLLVQVAQHDSLRKLYINEMQLSDLLFDVEDEGVKVDTPYLEKIEPIIRADIETVRLEICADVGYEFDIDSNPQLIKALQEAGCRLTKLTKKGKELAGKGDPIDPLKHFSVDDETLEYLAVSYKFAGKVREYRKRMKILNTYVIKIRHLVDENRYLHSTFNQNVSTGRMSSREPNVQNIPARNKEIRKAFTLPERVGHEGEAGETGDWMYVFMDYSQVELRLTAHWSGDPTFLATYPWDGPAGDLHTLTAADAVLGRPLAEVEAILADDNHPENNDIKFYRNIAKRVNFGIIYGAAEGAIQRQVSSPDRPVTKAECKTYIEKYFARYGGVKDWIDGTGYALSKNGHLQNSFGRYRRLPDSQSSDKWQRLRAGRQGVNFLIQGDAADLFKTAAVRVRKLLRDHNAKTRIVNFVHDEIQFYWHKSEFHLLKLVKATMEDFPQFKVPIVAEIEVSKRDWASKKKLKAA